MGDRNCQVVPTGSGLLAMTLSHEVAALEGNEGSTGADDENTDVDGYRQTIKGHIGSDIIGLEMIKDREITQPLERFR